MTTTSPILVCPVIPLRHLPDSERDVIRRFVSEHVRGMDAANHRRWMRLWGQIFKAEAGEGFQFYRLEERSGPFHRRHRVILEKLFHAQERFRLLEPMHDWIKVRCYFVTWGEGSRGQPMPVPRSTNFDECPEADMRELHTRMVDLLHEPTAQRYLFPKVKASQRQGMVDAVLADEQEAA